MRKGLVVIAVFCSTALFASDRQVSQKIDVYIQPYVQTNNFSGAVLVKKGKHVLFEKAYGISDREHQVPNTTTTRFHVASVSMQFTAAAALRLVDQGTISLDMRVGDYVTGIEGADKITVRDLLMERSGLPDINSFPDYNEVLEHHQTPASLIAKLEGHPVLFEPATKYLHEEHSAYNLLALIIEKKAGYPFATAVERLVLRPAGLSASGIDDDLVMDKTGMAAGYEPEGVSGLKPAGEIHWSGKTGNASMYTTVEDEARFVETLFQGKLLSPVSRSAVLDATERVGYGWFRGENKRFGQTAFYMNGRAPGFAAFVLYLPTADVTVVAFSNIYSSATTSMGYDIAAIALGLPYVDFHPAGRALSADELRDSTGNFRFGPNFYQPNGVVNLAATGSDVVLEWPSGGASPLIPLERDHFMDRSYWEEVKIERNSAGQTTALRYGDFRGEVVKAPAR